MSNEIHPHGAARRRFMRMVGLGGAAAGVVVGTGLGLGAAPVKAGAVGSGPAASEAPRGYRLTAHIREYYRKAAL